MSSTPPTKRQRTDEDASAEATDNADGTPKSYLWFEDGNVVLQAQDTLFRVHQSVLSLHSEVFSDMFKLPLPSDDTSQPMFEQGCPLISLSDSAEDLTCLLSNIYENCKKYDYRQAMEPRHAIALFRLGNKYGIEYLQKEIIDRLKTEFPSTLAAWDRSFDGQEGDFEVSTGASWNEHERTAISNLAYEFDIQILLPAVYAEFHNLNDQLLKTCLIGKEKLSRATLRYLSTLPHADLDPTRKCSHLIWGITEALSDGVCCLDPLFELTQSVEIRTCENCYPKFVEIYEAMREVLWDRLPSFFGLPKWEELKDS
ncbi:hypothetical protein CPC08DRAFT_638595 [Agrocybe pediades]|nr:hypothetical protein CPC08DRAFT_638595 [Agrocybe pediades]